MIAGTTLRRVSHVSPNDCNLAWLAESQCIVCPDSYQARDCRRQRSSRLWLKRSFQRRVEQQVEPTMWREIGRAIVDGGRMGVPPIDEGIRGVT
jgi:hypothetical protein